MGIHNMGSLSRGALDSGTGSMSCGNGDGQHVGGCR